MNRLRLEHRLERHPYWPDSVCTALFVDGQELTCREWPSVVDLTQLQASADHDGTFYLFTCECGEPRCAGIEEPVTIRHDAAGVHWQLGDAWRFVGVQPHEGEDWEAQVRHAAGGAALGIPHEFVFPHAQYAVHIEQDIRAGQALITRLDRFVTFTPDINLAVLQYPDLPSAAAHQRHAAAFSAWREQHPLPPGPARWGRMSDA